MQDHLENLCKVFLVFRFSSAKYYINLIKNYLLPLFVNERGIEPIVSKKASKFVPFKFRDVPLLD